MKILLITDNHSLAGGAEQYFFDLKKRLQNKPGLQVFSLGFGSKESRGDDFFILKGIQSNAMKFFWQHVFHPLVYFKLRNRIKKINPDIIHLHHIKQYTPSLLHAVKNYPLIQTIHDYGAICPISYNIHKDLQACPTGLRFSCFWQHQLKYSPLVYLFMTLGFLISRKRIKKFIRSFFAPSPLLVESLKQNHFQDVNCIIPFKNQPKSPAFSSINPSHFLFAGNLGAHKGIHILLEEFALAHAQNPEITLTIAGKGPDEQMLRNRIRELNLENHIHFAGWQKNLDALYKKSAAVIFPSLWMEAFGLVITEAMNHSRPVIGSNRGSPPWIIDDTKTGLIFDPVKKGNLAEKILTLASNIELITTMGKNAEEKLNSMIDNEATLNQIVNLYQQKISQFEKRDA